MPHIVSAGFLLTMASFGIVTPPCAAQRGPKIDAKRPFTENVTLPVDANLEKQFRTVDALFADSKWNEAISLIQEIVQTESKSLIRVQKGKTGGIATYVNVASHCNLLLSRAPAEGREVYRQKVDPQSRRWYENWQRTRDEAELLRIVRQAYLSRLGDDALLALGEAAWDRGDFSAARLWWGQLKPLPDDADPADYPTVLRYPDTDLDLASVLARIVLCSVHEMEYERAEDELRELSEQYPLSEGWLCGKQGRLVELVRQTISESHHWKRIPAAAEVSTFGMSPERYFRIPESIDVGALRWVRPLPTNVLRQGSERSPFLSDPLSYHPVVFDKIVLVNDSDGIRAWNLLSGEPAWQSERRDPSVIFPSNPDKFTTPLERPWISERRDPSLIYPTVPDEQRMSPDKPCVGAPHYTMTIANGRLYARMGSPVTCSSIAELRREFASDLVCLDLTQEGKLVWKFGAHELFPEDPPWRYEGTPVVVGGRAYVTVCRRHPQLELMVACLDAFDGRLIWKRPIGSFRASVDESHNRVSHLLLTAGGGRLFLSTDAGAVVAMDALDGRLEWAISYESRPEDTLPASSDPSRKGLTPPIFHAGLVFVAPHDATSAYCIEADSGRIHWQHSYLGRIPRDREPNRLRLKQWRHLLGVVRGGTSGRLIVSGNSLSAIDVETGDVVWERGEGTTLHAGDGTYGRGLIADNQVFLPLRESIQIFNASTGEHLRQVLLKTPDSPQVGGNLTLAGGMLLVAQPNRLAAYCEYSRLKQRIEIELTQRPDDVQLWIQLAEVETVEGHVDAAAASYRHVIEQIKHDDPDYFKVRRKLSRLLQEAGAAEFARKKPADAQDRWQQALDFTDDVTQRVDLIFSLAETDATLGQPEQALGRLQQILNNERLGSIRRESLTASHTAVETMSQLIAKYGRDAYAQIESDAARELDQLTKADDRHGLKRLITKYPHAVVAGDARNLLVQMHRKAGEFSEAFATLCEIERYASSDHVYVETTLTKIGLLQEAHFTEAANRLWRSLLARPLSMDISFAGKTSDLHELARQQLQQNESIRPTQPSFLQRTWSLDLTSDAWVVLPKLNAPATELESLLICSKDPQQSGLWLWRCIDWRTGQLRWQDTAPSPIRTASWTDVHLLIGTPNGWQARTPDTGRRVWEQTSLSESTPLIPGGQDDVTDQSVFPALFNVDRGLQLFDGNTGQLIAHLKPEGWLHSVFGITVAAKNPRAETDLQSARSFLKDRATHENPSTSNDRQMIVVMQTVKPTRVWCAIATSPRGKWSIVELAEGGEPWQGSPVVLGNQIVGLTNDHHLVGFGISDAQKETFPDSQSRQISPLRITNKWTYNNFTIGLAHPAEFSSRDRLLVVVDGSRLSSFDPVTGNRKWTTGLADFPLQTPINQLSAGTDCVFATSQGTLRAVSIIDGTVQQERYLGDTAPQWRTTVAWVAPANHSAAGTAPDSVPRKRRHALIAAWPLGSSNTGDFLIRLCDAETGTISQQLKVDSEPRDIVFKTEGFGVVWTSDKITGLKFASAESIADAGRPPGASRP